jgi:hypothetical protein
VATKIDEKDTAARLLERDTKTTLKIAEGLIVYGYRALPSLECLEHIL